MGERSSGPLKRKGARCAAPALHDVSGDLALILIPESTLRTGGVLRQRRLGSGLSGARSFPAERVQRFERLFDGAELGGERFELRSKGVSLVSFRGG